MSKLHLEAELWIDVDGRRLHFTAQGQSLLLEVVALRPLLQLGASRRQLAALAELLAAQGLTLDVVDRDFTLLRMGYNVASGWGRRLLGSSKIYIHHLPRLLVLLLRR